MKIYEVEYNTNEGKEIARVGGRSESEAIWLAECQDPRFQEVESISFLNPSSKEERLTYLSQINFYKDRK